MYSFSFITFLRLPRCTHLCERHFVGMAAGADLGAPEVVLEGAAGEAPRPVVALLEEQRHARRDGVEVDRQRSEHLRI